MTGAVYVKLLSEALDEGDVGRALVAVSGVLSLLTTLASGTRESRDDSQYVAAQGQDGHDELLMVREAASRLRTSTDWLYRHAAELPFTVRLGRQLRFSARGIDAWTQARKAAL